MVANMEIIDNKILISSIFDSCLARVFKLKAQTSLTLIALSAHYNNDFKMIMVNINELKDSLGEEKKLIEKGIKVLISKGLILELIGNDNDNDYDIKFKFTQKFWDFISPQIKLCTQYYLDQINGRTDK